MRRTLISVVLTLGLLFAPATFAADTAEPGNGWLITLQEAVEDLLDTILFWTEDPPTVTGEIAGMPEPLG